MKKLFLFAFLFTFFGCGSEDEKEITFIIHSSETITQATTWSGNHKIQGTLTVNGQLNIDACTLIHMDSDSVIHVSDGGSVVAVGRENCPIEITSAKEIPAAGDWSGIEIYPTASSNNEFTWVNLKYAGSDYGAFWLESNVTIKFSNLTLENIKDNGIVFGDDTKLPVFSNVKFKNVGSYLIEGYADGFKQLTPIVSENNSKNYVYVKNGALTETATWKNLSVPYLLESLDVEAPLTIEEGTILNMKNDSVINVSNSGAIITQGTELAPVVFNSEKSTPEAGDWSGFEIYATSSNQNSFQHTYIKNVGNYYGALWLEDGSEISISNTVFENVKENAITMAGVIKVKSFENNSFKNVEKYPIVTHANNVKDLRPIIHENLGKERVLINGGHVDTTGTWLNLSLPYELETIDIMESTLTVEEGVELLMAPETTVRVFDNGALILNGTTENRVIVKSSKSAPAGGDWSCFEIYATASNESSFRNADIMHGGYSGYGHLWIEDGATIELENVIFGESKDSCDVSGDGNIDETNTTYDICE